jgi:hypothetical protein
MQKEFWEAKKLFDSVCAMILSVFVATRKNNAHEALLLFYVPVF